MKYSDSAPMPIIAIDFDDTINIGGEYPKCGRIRSWAKAVINFMHALGIRTVIWTSRDVAYNQDEKQMYDHLTPMLEFLDDNDVHYDAINKSVQFSPYHYNGRKIYAHMYVDDRSFGWYGQSDGNDEIMLDVLEEFLYKVCGFSRALCKQARHKVLTFNEPSEYMILGVKMWKQRSDRLGPE